MKKTIVFSIFGAAALLAAMGLVFSWLCPSADHACVGERPLVLGMLVANLVGLVLGGVAVVAGWHRVLKAAPFVCLVWFLLMHFGMGQWPAFGRLGTIEVGPIGIDVLEMCPLVIGLLSAWVAWKWKLRSAPALLSVVGVLVGFAVGMAVMDANQMKRLTMMDGRSADVPLLERFLPPDGDLPHRSASMIQDSKWFGASEAETKVPWCAATVSMPATAAVLFGKWYLVLLFAAVGLMGIGFARVWKCVEEAPKRSFVQAYGIAFVGQSVMNILGCLQVVPMMTLGFPWASYGVSMAAANWLALGILVALVLDNSAKDESAKE